MTGRHGRFHWLRFTRIYLAFLPNKTRKNPTQLTQPCVQPRTNHRSDQNSQPICTDEGDASNNPHRINDEKKPVPYGCAILSSWGRPLMMNVKKWGKWPFYTNKISRLALTLPIFDCFGKMGYQIDPLVKPNSKHSLLFLEGSILGPFTYLKGTVLKGHYSDQVLWPTRRYTCTNLNFFLSMCVALRSFLFWMGVSFCKNSSKICFFCPSVHVDVKSDYQNYMFARLHDLRVHIISPNWKIICPRITYRHVYI